MRGRMREGDSTGLADERRGESVRREGIWDHHLQQRARQAEPHAAVERRAAVGIGLLLRA